MAPRLFKLKPALAVVLISGAASGIAFHAYSPNPFDSPSNVTAGVGALVDAVVRSSRAIATVGLTIADYKYSLHGLQLHSDEYRRERSEVHLRSARRILELCEANKGFYTKAGQFASAMGQVPKEYADTLSSLQDKALPCSFEAIREVLASNFGEDFLDKFDSFDEHPIAAASIAQVHHARLKDLQEVAVKVQYPGLERQMNVDIMTMAFLSKSVAQLYPEYRFESMLAEFSKAIALELDFIQEARNSERTAKNFINKDILRIPKIFWELTTSQVLTMQFCEGKRVDDVDFLKKMGIDPTKVAKALAEVFAEMIFTHGFVHGDPHPGNILVSPLGQGGFSLDGKITVLLDHGVYKQLEDEFRQDYCQLWKALILLDSNKIQQLGERFGVGKYSKYFPLIFTGRTIDSKSALGNGMSAGERNMLKKELQSLSMEDVSSFTESLPPDFLMVLRVDGLLRSLNRKLGAPQRVRLLTYAKFALYGLSSKPNAQSVSAMKMVLSKISNSMAYLQLRLVLEIWELLSWMRKLRRSFVVRVKHSVAYFQRSLEPPIHPSLVNGV